jgi:ribosomal protein L31E
LSNETKVNAEAGKGVELSIRIKGRISPRKKKAAIVLRRIREAASKKVKAERIVISPEVSRMIWVRGAEHPPRVLKLSIEVNEEDGIATVLPVEVDRQD